MKKTLLILITIIALTGCVSTKTYSSYVTQKLEQQIHAPDIQDKNISFDFSKLEVLDNSVEAEKSKSFFIPAILYWGWENTIQCKINPNLIEKSFKLTFLHCADSIGLLNNLEGKKLEISIEAMPTSFMYTNQGNAIIFIIAYTVSELEAIYPQRENLVINYKLIKDEQTIKSGKLAAINNDQPIKNIWKSTKQFTWLYIDQFNNNTKMLTNDIVQQLLKNI